MNSLFFTIFALACATSVLSAPHRGTPAEYLEATTVAANGIWPAMGQASADIKTALAGEDELLAAVQAILDNSLGTAADIFVPALENLEAATTDEEAEIIVVETISGLIMIGLSTEYKIEDAIVGTSQEVQDRVTVVIDELVHQIKTHLKPLWVLTEQSRRH